MWPFGSSGDTDDWRLTDDDLPRDDEGSILCPQCETDMWTLHTFGAMPRFRRSILCDNCGFSGELKNGVELHASDE